MDEYELYRSLVVQEVLAYWMFNHPFVKVRYNETLFWYDNIQNLFMYYKTSNKFLKGPYRDIGFDIWLNSYISKH